MKSLPYLQLINKGIEQLSNLQEEDGSFLSFSSQNEHDFTGTSKSHTTFLSSVILSTISSLPENKSLDVIKTKLAGFLLKQKSDFWSWNYWIRGSEEAKKLPYPDDLDDTFYALAALTHYDKELITGEVFAHIVKLLTFTEKKEGGPYRTWLIKKNASKVWLDVDFAVNSNIAYFLSLHEVILPNLEKYFEDALEKYQIRSPYYPSVHAPLYFLSRFYTGNYKEKIANIVLKNKGANNGCFGNPLKTAMVILTLLNLGVPIEQIKPSILYLFQTQKKSMWKAYGFCIDPSKDGKQYFAGSAALTTAFCLTAIYRYQLSEQVIKRKNNRTRKEEKERLAMYESITQKITQHFSVFNIEIYGKANMLLQRIAKHDRYQQIPLLPYYFYQSLKKKPKKISKNILIRLGVANVFGWIAYTIFDDFLDEEGKPIFLPIATIALRKLTFIFDTFPVKKKSIQKLFYTFMNKIDTANAWELTNCRIRNGNIFHTNFKQLANKSIGHALGPLTILLLSGKTQKSKEFTYIESFFMHYLVAKQLNDDAHDWEKDFKKGHLTPVLSLLLKKAEEKNIIKERKSLYELFWNEVIQEVWVLVHLHARKAKTALRKSLLLEETNMLESLLDANVRSADLALEEQKNVTAFLKTYTH